MNDERIQPATHILFCIARLKHINGFISMAREVNNLVAVTGDLAVYRYLKNENYSRVYWIDSDQKMLVIKENITQVYIFESKLDMTCSFIEVLKNSLLAPVIVLTENKQYPIQLYQLLGVRYVIYSNSEDFSFLVKGK